MKKFIFVLLFLLAVNSINSQTILEENGSWFTFTNKVQLTEKLYLGNVTQRRRVRVSFMENIQAFLIKPGDLPGFIMILSLVIAVMV